MILKKMIVEGQEIHVQISKEEAVKAHVNQEPLIFTDQAEKEAFLAGLKTDEPKNEDKEEKPKNKSRIHKLVQMLPFMDEETIHELVDKILKEDGFDGIEIGMVLPFLDSEDATKLFKKAMSGNHPKLNPMMIAPFVDSDALSFIVDEFIAGNISESQLDALYPFLDEDDLKRLFKHIINES